MKRYLKFRSPARAFTFGWMIGLLLVLLVASVAHAQVTATDASYSFIKEYTFHASAAETGAGHSSVIDVSAYASGQITVNLTAISGGTTTLDVTVYSCQTSTWSTTTCISVATMTQLSGTGSQLINVSGFQRYLAVGWTPGSGTSATFTAYGAFKPYPLTAVAAVKAPSNAPALTDPAQVVTLRPDVQLDPCASPQVAKTSTKIAVSSQTTAQLIAPSTGKSTYVCGFAVTYTSGTTPTLKFISGTQTTTACDTGPADLTGVMSIPATAGQGLVIGAGQTMFSTAASTQLCIVSGGTTPNYNGFITYVQQ